MLGVGWELWWKAACRRSPKWSWLKRHFVGRYRDVFGFVACSCRSAACAKLVVFASVFNHSPTSLRGSAGPRRREGRGGARARRRGGRGGAEGTEARSARRRGGHGGEGVEAYRIASHRRVVSCRARAIRASLARHARVANARTSPLTTTMTTTRRDDDTAATPCVAVAAVAYVGGVGVA